MTQTSEKGPKVGDVVERYMALRQHKAEMKKAYDDSVKPVDDAMDKLENWLLKQMQDTGVDSFKTPFGTAYSTTKTSCTVGEWSAVLDWVRSNEEWGMLTQAVSKDAVKAYREEHNDLPPGVNWREVVSVNILKAK